MVFDDANVYGLISENLGNNINPRQSYTLYAAKKEAPLTQQPASDRTVPKRNAQGRFKLALVAGLVLSVALWFVLPTLLPGHSPAGAAKRIVDVDVSHLAPPVTGGRGEMQTQLTERRLRDLVRVVKVWLIQRGDGFKPALVNMDQLAQDMQMGIESLQDGWGHALRYEPGDDFYLVRSAGPDGRFDTADDLQQEGRVAL